MKILEGKDIGLRCTSGDHALSRRQRIRPCDFQQILIIFLLCEVPMVGGSNYSHRSSGDDTTRMVRTLKAACRSSP